MSSYIQGNTLSAVYDIWINGTKLDLKKKSCISSVDIKETVEGSDIATITIADPDFIFIDDNLFLEDVPVKIQLGWDITTYRVNFDGYISAIDIDFENTGCPRLTINCMDKTHVMNRKKKDATFSNCTSADVVKRIVQEYGFSCVIQSNYQFTLKETITQSNQTDIDFITKLAGDEVHPFTARLVGNTFYYVKMGNMSTPVMDLSYRNYPHEIVSFSPRINKETRQIEIESSTIDTGNKDVSTTKGTNTGDTTNTPTNTNNTGNSGGGKGSYTFDPATGTWTQN